MSVNAALDVRCLHCGSIPGAVCLTPPWPGRGQQSRTPLRFHPAHPVRVALAAAMEAGATDREGARAARVACRTTSPEEDIAEIPYLDVALIAVAEAELGVVLAYRKHNPPAPGVPAPDPNQPELDLG